MDHYSFWVMYPSLVYPGKILFEFLFNEVIVTLCPFEVKVAQFKDNSLTKNSLIKLETLGKGNMQAYVISSFMPYNICIL